MSFFKDLNYFYYKMSLYELQMANENNPYYNLSYNTLLYLNIISQTKECTITKIAEMLNITKSAVTIKVNELVKQNIITKIQNEKDKRIFYLSVTPEIKKTLNFYDNISKKIEMKLKEKYSKEEMEIFSKILHTISEYEWRNL